MPEPGVPIGLVGACAAGDVILFAGDVLATAADYPSRADVVRTLANRISASAALDLLEAGAISDAADVLSVEVDTRRIAAEVVRSFAPRASADRVASVLRSIPFRLAISFSWDDVVERAFGPLESITSHDVGDLEARLADVEERGKFLLIKLFGDRRAPETITISLSRALDEAATNRPLQRYLTAQYFTRSFLFCGLPLRDVEAFLGALRIRDKSSRPHFAVIPYDVQLDAKRTFFRERYGVQLIAIDPLRARGQALRFLDKVSLELRNAPSQPDGPQRRIEDLRLRTLRLENIGPFRELSVDLSADWNVLLGNNGCGKSTILKAIALALSGEDERVRDAARDLLRYGADKGSIELELGEESLRTVITRKRSRVVVEALQTTPLEAGRWSVLGFPPLRAASSNESKGPAPTTAGDGPEVADVLPLLLPGVDLRTNELTQWIVNMDALASKGGSSGEVANRRLDSFFRLMQALTPDVRFERGVVDESFRVWIVTEDGRVPANAISQGMSSIMGWAGLVLQRLSAMHPDDEQPERRPALVLVDELDAHMHPAWQMLLAPTVKRHFPALQVVATTHSPLIVANLEQREVQIVRRERDRVLVEGAPESFKGWRVDQILTSLAFDMPGTRDADTTKDLSRYLELASKFELPSEEEGELASLASKLGAEMPSPQTRASAMKAFAILEDAIRQHFASMPEAKREPILKEIRLQLQGIPTEPGQP